MRPQSSIWHHLSVLPAYRSRLVSGVLTDVRQRYAGSALGIVWALLYPMLLLGIYSVVYLFIFKVRVPSLDQYGYLILVFSGLTPILAFNEALINATSSLTTNKALLLNTVFPAELIPVRGMLAGQLPSLLALIITLLAAFAMGRTNWLALTAIPLLWILLVMFICGLGWVLSLVSLVLRDIQQGLALVLMILMIMSPFAYTPDMVPSSMKAILYFNPISYYVMSFQEVICYGKWPSLSIIGPAILISIITFIGGFWVFIKTKSVFLDNV